MCILAYLQYETTLKLTYVIGKSPVPLIRLTTMSKLKLQAVVNEVRLKRQILRDHDVKIDKTYQWSDSPIVLQRLQAAHKKQQVFVANRVAEVLECFSLD